jgi:hypothetical protein
MNEGSGTSVANTSPNNANWNMTLSGDPGLWGYWQPGAYAFAGGFGPNVNNFRTALTASPGWSSGDNLTLKADINVTASIHDVGTIFKGGSVFGAGYFMPGGNSLGYNYGAFYASLNTSVPSAPSIRFEVSGIGTWSQALPASVTDMNMNGGWNTVEWSIANNNLANTMSLQFRLNGSDVGAPISISGYYMHDFTDFANYQGAKFYIGAQADQDYNTFTGSIRNVSLVASVVPEPSLLALIGLGTIGLPLFRRQR